MTRDEWKDWFRKLRDTHEDWQVLDSVADLGEQADMLNDVRLAAWGSDPTNKEA